MLLAQSAQTCYVRDAGEELDGAATVMPAYNFCRAFEGVDGVADVTC